MITVKFTEVPEETVAAIIQDDQVLHRTRGEDASFQIPPGLYTIRVRHPRSAFTLEETDLQIVADLTVCCARVRARW